MVVMMLKTRHISVLSVCATPWGNWTYPRVPGIIKAGREQRFNFHETSLLLEQSLRVSDKSTLSPGNVLQQQHPPARRLFVGAILRWCVRVYSRPGAHSSKYR